MESEYGFDIQEYYTKQHKPLFIPSGEETKVYSQREIELELGSSTGNCISGNYVRDFKYFKRNNKTRRFFNRI